MADCKILKYAALLILSVFLLLLPVSATGLTDEMKALYFTDENGTEFPYRLHIPYDYSSQKKYPLLLFLHGAGESGSDNKLQIVNNAGIIEKIIYSCNPDYDCIIIAPQSTGGWTNPRLLKALKNLVTQVQKSYTIDGERLYIAGLSMGGYGTWEMITSYPDMFAAAIPICGGGDPSKARLIKDMAIWAFHGSIDSVVPVTGTREMIAALKNCGSNARYTEYSGVGHYCWHNAYAEASLLPWLFAQKKGNAVNSVVTTAIASKSEASASKTEAVISTKPRNYNYLFLSILMSVFVLSLVFIFVVKHKIVRIIKKD